MYKTISTRGDTVQTIKLSLPSWPHLPNEVTNWPELSYTTIQLPMKSDTYTYLSTIWRADGPLSFPWPNDMYEVTIDVHHLHSRIAILSYIHISSFVKFDIIKFIEFTFSFATWANGSDEVQVQVKHLSYCYHIRRLDCHNIIVLLHVGNRTPPPYCPFDRHTISWPLLVNFCSLWSLLM